MDMGTRLNHEYCIMNKDSIDIAAFPGAWPASMRTLVFAWVKPFSVLPLAAVLSRLPGGFVVFIAVVTVAALAGVGLGIVRRRFGNTRMTFQRGAAFLLSVIAIGLIFFSLEFFVEKYFYQNDELVDIGAAIVGAFAFCHLKHFFEKATNSIFFRGQYDYADAMARTTEVFSSTVDIDALAVAAEDFLGATIKPSWVDFFRKDRSSSRGFAAVSRDATAALLDANYGDLVEDCFLNMDGEKDGADASKSGESTNIFDFGIGAIVPTTFRNRMNALLVVGGKMSGEAMSSRDLKLLAAISRQIGMAVENVGLYEEARRHAEELERKVAERTERIKSMHEAQSKFLADLSHEFQTPLTILKMNVEVFAKKPFAERKKAVYVMETTLDRLSRLTRGLVDVARFDFFRETFERHRIDIMALAKEAREDCLVLAKDRGIAVSCSGTGGSADGDRDKLKEVLLNLLGNALKHTATGGVVIVSVERREGEVEIVVADSGKGIPARNLPLIFERFYRINEGISEGTGLGLHLCRKIVEAHGGTIIAESSVGQGSRFVIHLPLVDS